MGLSAIEQHVLMPILPLCNILCAFYFIFKNAIESHIMTVHCDHYSSLKYLFDCLILVKIKRLHKYMHMYSFLTQASFFILCLQCSS